MKQNCHAAKAPCASLAAEEDCEEAVSGASLVAGNSAYMGSLESSTLPAAAVQGSQASRTRKTSVDEGHRKKEGPEQ